MKRAALVHLSTVHHTRDNRIYNKEVPALLAAGFDVRLVIRADADEEFPVPLTALRTPTSRLSRLVGTQLEAWRVLGRLRPRLLHVHDPELIPLAWAWSRTHRARAIYDAHEDLVDMMASKVYLHPLVRPWASGYARLLTRLADRSMDAVVAATVPVASRYSNPNTVVVHNYPWGSDGLVEPQPVPGRLVYVGDLSEERKLSFMIEVTRLVRARIPEAHLVLAGRVLADGEPVISALDQQMVTHCGLLPPSEIPGVLSAAHVGLIFLEPLANYTTSLPTKLFEYMAASVPFAASDFEYWRQTFGPHDAGIFVDSEDAEAAAAAIADLLADPERCASLGRHGRSAAKAAFSFESEASTLTSLVARLLQQRGPRWSGRARRTRRTTMPS